MRLDPRMATGDEDVDLGVRRVRTADVGDGSGTIMHQTHLPLRTWFLAAHLVATHSNGISALQLQAKLEIGSYKAAWLLLHKLRRAMVGPERDALEGMIEVDETSIAYRTKHDPIAGGAGRSLRSRKSKLKSVNGETGAMRASSMPPSGFSRKVM